MPKSIDITGERFGRLVALTSVKRNGVVRWLCACDCGRTTSATTGMLRMGRHRSCGCLRGKHRKTHGQTATRTYVTWGNMVQRTTNPKHPRFKDYGGRGILLDPRWLIFENFLEDMGERPPGKFSIERIENDGPYTKANCIWATPSQQMKNRRWNGPARDNLTGRYGRS